MKPPTDHPIYPIHNHTGYSMLDGADPVSAYVEFARKNKMPICAVTDHGYVSGCHELQKECEKAKIKPARGVEFYLDTDGYINPQTGKPLKYWHLTVWAADERGWMNIKRMTAASFIEGRPVVTFGSVKPRIKWEDLEDGCEGIIAGTGCLLGPVCRPFTLMDVTTAEMNFRRLRELFRGRLFAEIMPSRVVCDYTTRRPAGREIVQFEDRDGNVHGLERSDIIQTEFGEMTAEEAVEERPSRVTSLTPARWLSADLDDREAQIEL